YPAIAVERRAIDDDAGLRSKRRHQLGLDAAALHEVQSHDTGTVERASDEGLLGGGSWNCEQRECGDGLNAWWTHRSLPMDWEATATSTSPSRRRGSRRSRPARSSCSTFRSRMRGCIVSTSRSTVSRQPPFRSP